MLDNDLIQSTSSWPFVEVRKLLKDRKEIIRKKDKITFQTGYGPSGLPHIGTFGEVARTTMMINALNHIQKTNHELITFSDDMDGLRKVPENIPNDLQILLDSIALSVKSLPYISKSTSKVNHLIAQSTFHCSLQFPSRILVSIFSSLLSKTTFPVFLSMSIKGISKTFPVFGQIGKNGQ